MNFQIDVDQNILKMVAHLDHFRGVWSGGAGIPASRRARLREEARVQSTLTACSMGGVAVTEAEIRNGGSGDAEVSRKHKEVVGFLNALKRAHNDSAAMVTTRTLRDCHATILGRGDDSFLPSDWRTTPYDREAFDSGGSAMGRVFTTLPPHAVPESMEDLVTWLELELHGRENHPLLVIGAVSLALTAASPFSKGNGRLVWVMIARLMERAGYAYVPYAGLLTGERRERTAYYEALDRSQNRIWSGDADLRPWLTFFLDTLVGHADRVRFIAETEHSSTSYSPLQRKIVETVKKLGSAEAGLLMRATGANRNTLKDNLRRLVDQGNLERLGKRRGTRYRIPAEF
ncbi:MAG: Fic family protein [Acidobacteria bacterium]|uniref:Fic family protein n=1 Tax=Candidatus Polarisedimenticola svalbardensis TaxID=2886004 RepID=A0A8J6XUP6_9BACT|nr:Fic family protein [Candidatus Polarisedimenticola svalbardensis]